MYYSPNLTMLLSVIKAYIVNYILGDPFKDAGKLKMRETKKDGHKEAGHDLAFKPTKTV
jgi:hypothetical protein